MTLPDYTKDQAIRKFQLDNNEWYQNWKILYEAVLETNAKEILEIGTRSANSTRIFLDALEQTDGHITTVDIHPQEQLRLPTNSRLDFIQKNSSQLYWRNTIDILFLDGDHSYEQVLIELCDLGHWVRKGGQILLHDIYHEEHGKEIRQAIKQYCERKGKKYEWKGQNQGIGIIRID